jgi:hypothetical protein
MCVVTRKDRSGIIRCAIAQKCLQKELFSFKPCSLPKKGDKQRIGFEKSRGIA